MRIAIVSDNHWHECPLPEADFFVHCGDMTRHGRLNEVAIFAERLRKADYRAGILVPGNHDWCFESMPRMAAGLFDKRYRVLIDESWEYQDVSFYGSPWTLPFNNWAFMRPDPLLVETYKHMPGIVDVLVTHGPAYGMLDSGLGSIALRQAMDLRKVAHHVFGHIHSHGGEREVKDDGNMAYNVSLCDECYALVNPPLLLELP